MVFYFSKKGLLFLFPLVFLGGEVTKDVQFYIFLFFIIKMFLVNMQKLNKKERPFKQVHLVDKVSKKYFECKIRKQNQIDKIKTHVKIQQVNQYSQILRKLQQAQKEKRIKFSNKIKNIQRQIYLSKKMNSIQKLVESFLGFKQKRTTILTKRNSLLKLLFIINIPNIIILYLVNSNIKQPYMDEEFHYRQFSTYYAGDFKTWDPKITTPPGLYYVQYIFSQIFGGDLSTMRAINALIFSNIFLIFITKIYQFKDPNTNNTSRALNLALTPTIYFFNFMDYTDTLSITLITMAFYYNMVKSNYRLAFTSLLSLYVRQNNIIWIGFFMIYRILTQYKKQMFAPKPFLSHIFTIIKVTWNHKTQIIRQLSLQIIVIVAFFAYLKIFNQGHFVFGDRQNHQMHIHPVQILYLSLFMVINLPLNIDDYSSTFKLIFQKLFYSRHFLAAYLFLLAISIILVDKFTLVHQFTLADNRHFIFYIYRLVHKFWVIKWIACLVYPLCILFLFRTMVNSQQKLFKFLLWLVASFGYLAFGKLVQFRYYAISLLLYSFEIENRNINIDVEKIQRNQLVTSAKYRMIWTTIVKCVINAAVLSLFLCWEFNNQYGKGRIMW